MANNILRRKVAVDYLGIRLRRIVRSVIQREKMVEPSTWFAFLTSKQHSLITKILRSMAFTICVVMFLAQLYDRTCYYFTHPVTTDVFITENTDELYPDLTICHDPIQGTANLYRELHLKPWECDSLAVEVITSVKRQLNLEELWRRIKAAEDIVSAKLIGNSYSENLEHSDILMLYGNCATFHRNSTSPLRNTQVKFEILLAYKVKKLTSNRLDYYKFQHRKSQPCVSDSDYRKCVHECYINYCMNKAGCRLPFLPNEIKLPKCGHKVSRDVWYHMQKYLRGNIQDNCTCNRQCTQRIFDSNIATTVWNGSYTVYILEFGNSYITVIIERFVYTIDKLLADIGGNSGLWIGLSALSIFDVLPSRRKSKKNQYVFSPTDPLYHIVVKRIRRDRNSLKPQLIKSTNQFLKIFKALSFASVASFFAFAVINRLTYFFQHPVHSVVEVEFTQTFRSPSVTICPGDHILENQQREYARKNNISDYCEVKRWQLLDQPGTDARTLWTTHSKSTKDITNPATPEYMYEGPCFNTLHRSHPISVKGKAFVDSTFQSLCGTNYKKLYIKPPTGYYDYFLYRYIFILGKHSISFALKRIAANEDDTGCVSETNHESCKASCLTRKLWEKINCWLPFMPSSKLPLCNSSRSAKHSLQAYLDLYVLPGSSADCNCLPPCYKHIYDVFIEKQQRHSELASFGFGTRHNVMETYRKVDSYPIVALLCDIGGWLGSTLGFCVFGVFDIFLNTADKFKKRRLKKKDKK